MKNIRKMKQKLLMLISFFLLSKVAFGQPGWQDFTARYFYTILDANGKEISFKNNKNYSIMIDSVLYKSPNIPQDSLKHAIENNNNFENQIRINDFSFAVPQKNYHQKEKRLEIKIIHKKDTMYICQPSGIGSFGGWKIIDIQSKEPTKPEADFMLPFKPGHYYFPNWTQDILKHLPETSGSVKFLNTANLNEPYFIIPEDIYSSSILYKYDPYKQNEADDYVANYFFVKGHFSAEKRIEPTKNNQLPIEFSWIGKPVSTKDTNRFWGMIDYSGSSFSRRTTFFSLNSEENTIELFLPTDDPRLFECKSAPYVDTFNSVFYLPVWIKQKFSEEMSAVEYNKIPPKKYIYHSQDEGLTWVEDQKANEIFEKYHFFEKYGRKIEFIDKDYALVYFKEVIERNEKKNRIREQGTYYLLKNMQVIDSLKSPNDVPFYMYYNEISVENGNFVRLGEWSYDYDKTYFQLSLNKANDKWKFQVEKKFYAQNSVLPQIQKVLEKDTIKEYKNFHLINNQELVLKNGSGKMILDGYYGNSIFEKDNQIYIIGSRYVYISFDSGTNWYLYPAPILPNTYYYLLGINEKNEISHFSNNRIDSKNCETRKTFYKFSLE